MHLFFYETDSATAKAKVMESRRNGTPARIRDARTFGGVAEPCEQVTVMGDVSERYASPVRKAYAGKVTGRALPAETKPQPEPEADDMAALRAEYEHVLGKRPFPGWKAGTLRQKIAEAGE